MYAASWFYDIPIRNNLRRIDLGAFRKRTRPTVPEINEAASY